MTLEAENLVVELGGVEILRDVSLSVAPGESLAIVGPNGAGKSTLLRALAGLIPVASGAVRVGELNVLTAARRNVAKEIAFVPPAERPAFDFSLLEFVLMGCHARLGRFAVESETERRIATETLAELELSAFADRAVGGLSSGEYQRAVLARTLMTQTDVWLLDEPTSNLDPRHQVELSKRVRAHADGGGIAVTVLHDLTSAEAWCDRVVVLAEGRVFAEGDASATLTTQNLKDVYGVAIQRVETEYGTVFIQPTRRM